MAKKLKITISIDADLAETLQISEKDTKGGVSGWINDACRKKMKADRRAERRRQEILATRRNRVATSQAAA